jgi:hypothetical protein
VPIDIRYSLEKNILYVTVGSHPTVEEFASVMREITQSAVFPPDVPTLWNLGALEFEELDRRIEEQLIEIRKHHPDRGRARLAFVVPSELGFGLLRMYGSLSAGLPQQLQVFRGHAEAEAWLRSDPRPPDNHQSST